MSGRTHTYTVELEWTGNAGTGTVDYAGYSRDHIVRATGKPDIAGSSDPAFRGDATRYNPEDLLVASLASCHMLWYLHVAAVAGVVVTAYADTPIGTLIEDKTRGGRFTGVTLRPRVTITAASDPAKALSLHAAAHRQCFVANSVTFPVDFEPEIVVGA